VRADATGRLACGVAAASMPGIMLLCRNVRVPDGGIVSAKYDFDRCSFMVVIKNTTIESKSGITDFAIAIGGFNETVKVDLQR